MLANVNSTTLRLFRLNYRTDHFVPGHFYAQTIPVGKTLPPMSTRSLIDMFVARYWSRTTSSTTLYKQKAKLRPPCWLVYPIEVHILRNRPDVLNHLLFGNEATYIIDINSGAQLYCQLG